jgi:hypothetical protein
VSDEVITGELATFAPDHRTEALRAAAAVCQGTRENPLAILRLADELQAWLESGSPVTGEGHPSVASLEVLLKQVIRNQEIIMSEDASVLAVVTDETAQVAALGTAVGALQTLVLNLQALPPTALQPGTLAALQAAQASLDTLAATGAADVSADSPPAAPPAS